MVFLKERIGKTTEYFGEMRYPKSRQINQYRCMKTAEKFADIRNLDTSKWDDFDHNQIWGGHREYYWFETTISIPEEYSGQCVVYELRTGREGGWDATNPQFSLYVNGELRQGLDINHREVMLTENAVAGESFRIVLSAFSGDSNFSLLLDSHFKTLDLPTEKYYYDILVPYKAAELLTPDERAYQVIIGCLNESINLLDLRKEYSAEYYESLKKAQEYLSKNFYGAYCGNSEARVYCVGHTHIDVAWLWTLSVTRDKAVRSFSTVLELMRRYPDYKFMSSQPQLYQYVKENAPEIYEGVKQRVKEGRWETEGGMWVEADCNLTSGEALVRQFIYGKRFFKQEFGKDNVILWLPDVFGYSAALPQIMDKCGIKYFMTTKISWNDRNRMPYDTFQWEGLDGTKILTHFIAARGYYKTIPPDDPDVNKTFYNGTLDPSFTKGTWQGYSQKYLNDTVLMAFGYGDGGGGPTGEMLENHERLKQGIPGCPVTVMSTAKDYFELLEKQVGDHKYLPTWTGELYLEYHRGTYTSMGRNKRYNRKSEFAYQNAELYAILEREWLNGIYPGEKLKHAWEVILRNQFHDILPGSSIKEVYEESREEYEAILAANKELVEQALQHMADQIAAPKNSLVLFNPNGFTGKGLVSCQRPKEPLNPVVCDDGVKLQTQKTQDGNLIFVAKGVPGKGYKTVHLMDEAINGNTMQITEYSMENIYFSIRLNEKGHFTSIYDKAAGRNILKPGECGNVIVSYEDRPHQFDAWNLEPYYEEKSWDVDDVAAIEVLERGPVRGTLRISRKYLDSRIVQEISVYSELPRIDIKNRIDWKEKQIFVKSYFPLDIHTNEATYEIQFGNVKRPTHYNTSWDQARFEVCAHKWLDVAEDSYGVSFLNDCKYGFSVHNGVVGLSLLKSGIDPNPEADKEYHDFTYSIYPHAGDWREAETVPQAYLLNNPICAVVKSVGGGTLLPSQSFVSVDSNNVIIETVKKAEEGEEIIVRLYECFNRRKDVILTFAKDIRSVMECNLLEEDTGMLVHDRNEAFFTMKPYEIRTFKVKLL
jgi:alpha-mannosidase